jgi:hypothetical protein
MLRFKKNRKSGRQIKLLAEAIKKKRGRTEAEKKTGSWPRERRGIEQGQ